MDIPYDTAQSSEPCHGAVIGRSPYHGTGHCSPYDTADALIARHRHVINAIIYRTVQHSGNATDVFIRCERACHREVSDDTAVIVLASYDAEQSDIIVDCVIPLAFGIVIIQPADRVTVSVKHAEIA